MIVSEITPDMHITHLLAVPPNWVLVVRGASLVELRAMPDQASVHTPALARLALPFLLAGLVWLERVQYCMLVGIDGHVMRVRVTPSELAIVVAQGDSSQRSAALFGPAVLAEPAARTVHKLVCDGGSVVVAACYRDFVARIDCDAGDAAGWVRVPCEPGVLWDVLVLPPPGGLLAVALTSAGGASPLVQVLHPQSHAELARFGCTSYGGAFAVPLHLACLPDRLALLVSAGDSVHWAELSAAGSLGLLVSSPWARLLADVEFGAGPGLVLGLTALAGEVLVALESGLLVSVHAKERLFGTQLELCGRILAGCPPDLSAGPLHVRDESGHGRWLAASQSAGLVLLHTSPAPLAGPLVAWTSADERQDVEAGLALARAAQLDDGVVAVPQVCAAAPAHGAAWPLLIGCASGTLALVHRGMRLRAHAASESSPALRAVTGLFRVSAWGAGDRTHAAAFGATSSSSSTVLVAVSFAYSTRLLAIDDGSEIRDVSDASGCALDEASLALACLADGRLLQVLRRAVLRTHADAGSLAGREMWQPPRSSTSISCAAWDAAGTGALALCLHDAAGGLLAQHFVLFAEFSKAAALEPSWVAALETMSRAGAEALCLALTCQRRTAAIGRSDGRVDLCYAPLLLSAAAAGADVHRASTALPGLAVPNSLCWACDAQRLYCGLRTGELVVFAADPLGDSGAVGEGGLRLVALRCISPGSSLCVGPWSPDTSELFLLAAGRPLAGYFALLRTANDAAGGDGLSDGSKADGQAYLQRIAGDGVTHCAPLGHDCALLTRADALWLVSLQRDRLVDALPACALAGVPRRLVMLADGVRAVVAFGDVNGGRDAPRFCLAVVALARGGAPLAAPVARESCFELPRASLRVTALVVSRSGVVFCGAEDMAAAAGAARGFVFSLRQAAVGGAQTLRLVCSVALPAPVHALALVGGGEAAVAEYGKAAAGANVDASADEDNLAVLVGTDDALLALAVRPGAQLVSCARQAWPGGVLCLSGAACGAGPMRMLGGGRNGTVFFGALEAEFEALRTDAILRVGRLLLCCLLLPQAEGDCGPAVALVADKMGSLMLLHHEPGQHTLRLAAQLTLPAPIVGLALEGTLERALLAGVHVLALAISGALYRVRVACRGDEVLAMEHDDGAACAVPLSAWPPQHAELFRAGT